MGEGRILIVRIYMHIRGSLGQLTIRLPQQLKRKMKQLRDLNWSEIIREAIEARVLLESKRRLRDKSQALRAVKRMNEIADALSSRYSGPWNGAEVIRYWRTHRYSSSTPP